MNRVQDLLVGKVIVPGHRTKAEGGDTSRVECVVNV